MGPVTYAAAGHYGTGPIYCSHPPSGPLPYIILTLFMHEVPIKVLGGLWDQSHMCVSFMYGTSPMC